MKEAENRFEITKRVGLFGIIGNIFLLSIKAIVGFSTKSQAMIADSINSAGDIFASIMTSIGNKIASVPRDDDHNFGHGKAEYIFSLFISISMIFISIKTIIDAFKSLINGSQLTFSWWLVVVCIATIITKLCLYIYVKILYSSYITVQALRCPPGAPSGTRLILRYSCTYSFCALLHNLYRYLSVMPNCSAIARLVYPLI